MPFTSLISFLRGGSRSKANNTSSFKPQNESAPSGWSDYLPDRAQNSKSRNSGPTAALKSILVPQPAQPSDTERSERPSRRSRSKSRTPTRARSASRHSIRSLGRNLFGGTDADEEIPPMPRPVQQPTATATSTDVTPGTAITTDASQDQTAERRSKRHSLVQSLRSKKSWLGKSKDQEPTAEVLASTMPGQTSRLSTPATANLPAEQRRRRDSSARSKSRTRRGSDASTIRPKLKKKSSFWSSSNPDDSDSDVPPVPALVRGDTPDSSNASSPDLSDAVPAGGRRRPRRDGGVEQPRPLSAVSTCSKKSYTPKSAAKGFARSTSGATDEARQSFRQSFHLEDGQNMVCLTEEQQIEWARLMQAQGGKFADNPPEQPETTHYKGKNRFSNAQALAALEAPATPRFR